MTWVDFIANEAKKPYYQELMTFVNNEYLTKAIFPMYKDIFNAFEYTPFDSVKVVILGQDPYHGENQAHGLAFSVKKGIKIPPSLRNIYKELESDLGIKAPNHGYLVDWAKQGVLLINTVLTVQAHKANSHKDKGWEIFTDNVIKVLNEDDSPKVFVLWGNNAIGKKKYINNHKHMIIESSHPSPLSAHRTFFGSKVFSRINAFLKENGRTEIDFKIN